VSARSIVQASSASAWLNTAARDPAHMLRLLGPARVAK
jgi:hypothetical protein